jgi:hypothetical protein
MKHPAAFPVFALMLAVAFLSSCSRAPLPTITVTPQNGGTSFLITGSGFTVNAQSAYSQPCAQLSFTPEPAGAGTPVSIGKVYCNGLGVLLGSEYGTPGYTWTPKLPLPQCNYQSFLNTNVLVVASDNITAEGAEQSTSVLCIVPAPCIDPLTVETSSEVNATILMNQPPLPWNSNVLIFGSATQDTTTGLWVPGSNATYATISNYFAGASQNITPPTLGPWPATLGILGLNHDPSAILFVSQNLGTVYAPVSDNPPTFTSCAPGSAGCQTTAYVCGVPQPTGSFVQCVYKPQQVPKVSCPDAKSPLCNETITFTCPNFVNGVGGCEGSPVNLCMQ